MAPEETTTAPTGAPAAAENDQFLVRSFAQFIQTVEGGKLHADLSERLLTIARRLEERVNNDGGKAKATLRLDFTFTLDESGIFEIRAAEKVTLPTDPRHRSMLFLSRTGPFSLHNQQQLQLFGPPRTVGGAGPVRSV